LSYFRHRKRRKAKWTGHKLGRNCFLKYVIEGNIVGRMEMTVRRVRRRKQLLDDLKEKRGYCKLKRRGCYFVENSLCKKLYTSRKTNYGMNERTLVE